MCGFAGLISFSGHSCDKSQLSKMGQALRRRGPDEETIYQDEYLSFVFRRLSIIDLQGGTQPIWNEDHSIFVSVNGEIYNHRELKGSLAGTHQFRSDSDSEIVLHLYEELGAKAFDLLNGMYAIVIWDTKKRKLILARDRLGIKPLYYAETDEGIFFASELKALLMHPKCPREFNWGDMEGIGTQQKPNVSTYIKGMNFLPAGYFAQIESAHKIKITEYWNIEDQFKKQFIATTNIEKIEQEYYSLLEDSVSKRLMSDVPVGLFLSGGIDSSIIAALIAKESKDIHCFTVVERTTYRSGDVELAKQVTSDLGLPLYPVFFNTNGIANNFKLADLEHLICLMESPRFDPEWLFKSELHRVAKQQVPELKVILLGQGADEFAGGYSKYLGSNWHSWDDYLMHAVAPSLKDSEMIINHVPERFCSKLNDTASSTDSNIGIYNKKMKSLVYQLQHFNLWHEDRTSAYHGIESRVPFLDHRLVELLAGIPHEYHEELFWDKKIVRNVLKKCLPKYPLDHKKVPFFVTDDISSIDSFAISICINIYTSFKEKYIECDGALFRSEDVEAHYEQVKKGNKLSYISAWELIEIMSICIFNQYINNAEDYLEKYFFIDKPPLPLVEESQWEDLKQEYDNSNPSNNTEAWQLDSKINIPIKFQILNPLTEEDGATELILLRKADGNLKISVNDDYYWVVMLLDAMGKHTDNPKDIEYWSKKADIPVEQLIGVVSNLVENGFIDRISPEASRLLTS